MNMRDMFEAEGNWLFRRRSFLPLLLTPLLVVAFQKYSYPLGSHSCDLLWEMICLTVSGTGFCIRALTSGFVPGKTSGRTTRKGQQAELLNTEGMYSIMRHPLYAGNFFVGLGFALFFFLWWAALAYVVAFWLYYERIIFAEEEFLRKQHGDSFDAWAARTPAFLPAVSRWQTPELRFSVRTFLKREYRTFFLIFMVFTALEILSDVRVERKVIVDLFWGIGFVISSLIWIVLRILHKRTHVLNAIGR